MQGHEMYQFPVGTAFRLNYWEIDDDGNPIEWITIEDDHFEDENGKIYNVPHKMFRFDGWEVITKNT